MQLRAHQEQFRQVIDEIISGSSVKTIVVHCTPGGGKSLHPLQAGKLIKAGLADKIAWICPRMSLQDQGERNFLNPAFRGALGYGLTIRTACNDENCSRGTDGIITTYQALGVDDQRTVLRDFERYRYILVLDEFHHLAADDAEWTKAIEPLFKKAAFRILMTGTMQRGDEKRIAFLKYAPDPFGDAGEVIPTLGGDPETALIKYNRREALADRAIIPLEFHFADGWAKWQKESGKVVDAKLSTGRADANQALYTALKTEYAQELLAEGVRHWQNHRKNTNPNGSLLVVAASIESAKEYTAILKRQGLHAEIATSDDTPQALAHIKAFKGGKVKILVTVAMAYEGGDYPSVSHIIILTNIRSEPWMQQCVARAVRIDPLAGAYETQKGYIFAPADRMFVDLARKIEADQAEASAKIKTGSPGGNGNGGRPGITPLSSKILNGQADLFGYSEPAGRPYLIPPPAKTQREIETELRETIDLHVRGFARAYGFKPVVLNGEIKRHFGKARENMTVPELEDLRDFLMARYPVPQIRPPDTVMVPVSRCG